METYARAHTGASQRWWISRYQASRVRACHIYLLQESHRAAHHLHNVSSEISLSQKTEDHRALCISTTFSPASIADAAMVNTPGIALSSTKADRARSASPSRLSTLNVVTAPRSELSTVMEVGDNDARYERETWGRFSRRGGMAVSRTMLAYSVRRRPMSLSGTGRAWRANENGQAFRTFHTFIYAFLQTNSLQVIHPLVKTSS